jgi:hypothetical protein
MTTLDAAAAARRDWKVTPGYRVLIKVGWLAFALAVYGAGVAVVVGMPAAWWVAAGMGAVALLVAVLIPAPVPRDLIVGGRNHIGAGRPD